MTHFLQGVGWGLAATITLAAIALLGVLMGAM